MHHLTFVILCLIWGTSFILMDRSSLAFGPFSIGAAGTLGGSAVVGCVWLVRRTPCRMGRHHAPALLAVAAFGYSWPFVLQPYLINRIGHGYIGMIVCLVPLLTILLSIPVLRKYPSRGQLTGVLLGLGFLMVYFWDGLDRHIAPLLLVLAATVPAGYAIANVVVKRWLIDVPPVPLTCVALLLSGVFLLPLALTFETVHVTPSLGLAVAALVLLAILSRGTASVMFYSLIQKRGPLFAVMVTYIIPFVVLGWSWFDHERITLKQLVAVGGTLLMVGGIQLDIEREVAAEALRADTNMQPAP